MVSAPPIVPSSDQKTVYLMFDNFGGRMGRSWRETDEAHADREAVIIDLIDGQYHDPIRVIAFNAAEGWSRDATQDIAEMIIQECERGGFDIPHFLRSFVQQHGGRRVVIEGLPISGLP
jgi:hypothetical protein